MRRGLAKLRRGAAAVLAAAAITHVTAEGTNMQQAHEAMEIARSYKSHGDLRRAEHMFRVVMENSPAESNIHREAEDELEFYLPLVRIQRLMWDRQMQAAERQLFELQQAFEDQPMRLQQINRILSGLQAGTLEGNAQSGAGVDEKQVIWRARTSLDNYYRRNKSYPTNRSALADVLKLDEPPLDAFEIERYSSNGAGYLLVLRKKENKTQTITLQNTGLMQ